MKLHIPKHIPVMHIFTFAIQTGCIVQWDTPKDGEVTFVPATQDQVTSMQVAIDHIHSKQGGIANG